MEIIVNNSAAEIWQWNQKEILIETFDSKVVARITKWKFSNSGPSFGINHYRRQFLIPRSKKRLAIKLLGIPHIKNPNRVKAGKQAALDHPISRG